MAHESRTERRVASSGTAKAVERVTEPLHRRPRNTEFLEVAVQRRGKRLGVPRSKQRLVAYPPLLKIPRKQRNKHRGQRNHATALACFVFFAPNAAVKQLRYGVVNVGGRLFEVYVIERQRQQFTPTNACQKTKYSGDVNWL